MNNNVIEKKRVRIDDDNPSLQRIEKRCINCGMCYRICENVVGIDHKYESTSALCINCGQCIMNCPVGALCTKYDYKKVLNIINDTEKKVAVSIAPAVRVSLAQELGLDETLNMEGVLPTILRKLGFDLVFDVTFGADVTIMEEANELLSRLKSKKNIPMFTSCCPSWVKYARIFHPELIDNLSTTKSPIGIQSTLIKTYYKELNNISDEIVSVIVAPCTAKKYEIENSDTDYIITTNELAMMIRESEINLSIVKPSNFDALLSKGSKSSTMFGRSGGVMEATLNYFHYLVTGITPKEDTYKLTINPGINTFKYVIGKYTLNIAVITGMKSVEEILSKIDEYDFIEVMNCPNGCVSGGGQPLGKIKSLLDDRELRVRQLNSDNNNILYCYQNKEIKDLYSSYINFPLSKKAIEILHKRHNDLSSLINKNKS